MIMIWNRTNPDLILFALSANQLETLQIYFDNQVFSNEPNDAIKSGTFFGIFQLLQFGKILGLHRLQMVF